MAQVKVPNLVLSRGEKAQNWIFANPQDALLCMIYLKTGIIFIKPEDGKHYLFPNTLREYQHFMMLLNKMNTVIDENNQIIVSDDGQETLKNNIEHFENYFEKNLIISSLEEPELEKYKKISQAPLRIKNKVTVMQLNIETDSSVQNFSKQPSAFKMNDVYDALSNLESTLASNDKKLCGAIKVHYSIILMKLFWWEDEYLSYMDKSARQEIVYNFSFSSLKIIDNEIEMAEKFGKTEFEEIILFKEYGIKIKFLNELLKELNDSTGVKGLAKEVLISSLNRYVLLMFTLILGKENPSEKEEILKPALRVGTGNNKTRNFFSAPSIVYSNINHYDVVMKALIDPILKNKEFWNIERNQNDIEFYTGTIYNSFLKWCYSQKASLIEEAFFDNLNYELELINKIKTNKLLGPLSFEHIFKLSEALNSTSDNRIKSASEINSKLIWRNYSKHLFDTNTNLHFVAVINDNENKPSRVLWLNKFYTFDRNIIENGFSGDRKDIPLYEVTSYINNVFYLENIDNQGRLDLSKQLEKISSIKNDINSIRIELKKYAVCIYFYHRQRFLIPLRFTKYFDVIDNCINATRTEKDLSIVVMIFAIYTFTYSSYYTDLEVIILNRLMEHNTDLSCLDKLDENMNSLKELLLDMSSESIKETLEIFRFKSNDVEIHNVGIINYSNKSEYQSICSELDNLIHELENRQLNNKPFTKTKLVELLKVLEHLKKVDDFYMNDYINYLFGLINTQLVGIEDNPTRNLNKEERQMILDMLQNIQTILLRILESVEG